MTTETRRVGVWLGCAALLAGAALLVAHGCAGASKVRHGDTIDVTSYPKDIQAAYEVFAVRCSKCHTLARPLNARIHDAQHWVRYVTRMRRNPSSGINAKDAEIILRFLLYYMHQTDKAESEPEDEPIATPPASSEAPPSASRHPLSGQLAPPEPEEAQSPRPVEIAPAPRDQSAPGAAPEGNP
jgi:hypothetical protein